MIKEISNAIGSDRAGAECDVQQWVKVQFNLKTDRANVLQELDVQGKGDWVSFPLKWYLTEAEPGEYSVTLRVLRMKKASSKKKGALRARKKA
jgi:hypothetical protein